MREVQSAIRHLGSRRQLLLIILAAILLFLLCVLLTLILALTTRKNLVYSVKFACVPDAISTTVTSEVPFGLAFHGTAINIHNFTGDTVQFTKKAVLARSQDGERRPVSEKITEVLGPDQALFIDCLDISKLLNNRPVGAPFAAGDGFVIIESNVELEIVAVYTAEIKEDRVLYRFVTQPFKVRAVKGDGSGQDALPEPGQPPFQGFHPEVLNVDFEKTFDVLNKVIYAYEIRPKEPGCPGWDYCAGTREVLISAPGLGVPFPGLQSEEGKPNSLEGLVRSLDPSFKKIINVDATMAQRNEIQQEVTYRWVSDPKMIVAHFQPNVAVDVSDIVKDQDPPAPGQEIEILDTDIGAGGSEAVEREHIAPMRPDALPLIILVAIMVIIVIAILVILFFLIEKRRHPVKVLSGLLKVDPKKVTDGRATIDFEPLSVTDDANLGVHLETGDGVGRVYSTPPTVTVFVTKIEDPKGVPFTWSVAHTAPTSQKVQVSWTSDGLEIRELGYLVVGVTL
jgi:hypothetical protein